MMEATQRHVIPRFDCTDAQWGALLRAAVTSVDMITRHYAMTEEDRAAVSKELEAAGFKNVDDCSSIQAYSELQQEKS